LNMILEQEEETLDLNMIPKQVLPPSWKRCLKFV
jgi:hypothetical protein